MIEINLVPDVKQELIKAQHIRSTVISGTIVVGFVSIGVVVALALYVFGFQAARGSWLNGDITDKGVKLAKTKDLSKYLTIQNQLTKIPDLNNKKNIDSRFFDLLVSILPQPNDVQISDLSIDSGTTTITINGQSAIGYAAVEVFKKTIESAKIVYKETSDASNGKSNETVMASNISVSDTSYGEDSSGVKVLRFTLSFTYAEELFSPLSKNVSITVKNSPNATDSFIGIPTLTDRAKDLTGGQ